jgi:hypothetical protein
MSWALLYQGRMDMRTGQLDPTDDVVVSDQEVPHGDE